MPTATATKAKASAAKKAAAPAPPKPATRSQLLDRLTDLGYDGPTSFTATFLREQLVPWLEAGAPEGDGSIPTGVLHAVHPHLKPAPKAGNGEARTIARDLRRAASAALTAEDPTELLNEVDGLAARLREALAS